MGDIESAPFIEAMRQFQFRVGPENFALIHVSLVVDMHGEQKTKPTQSTVRDLRGLGLLPDLVRSSSHRVRFITDDAPRLLVASKEINLWMLQPRQNYPCSATLEKTRC